MQIRFVLIVIAMISSCKNQSEFVNYEKWETPSAHENGIVVGQPKEIKATSYKNLNDTSLDAGGELNDIEIWRFDTEGNLIHRLLTITNTSEVVTDLEYDENGLHYQSCGYELPRLTDTCGYSLSMKSRRIGRNKFEIISMKDGKERYKDVHIFETGKVVRERYIEGTRKGTATLWYNNNRLVKTEQITDKSQVIYYHRNAKGHLDSVTYADKNEREIFKRDEKGNCVYYLELKGTDTVEVQRFKYEYDSMGNWIRQLSFTNNPMFFSDTTRRFPGYSLTVREIKY